MAATIARAQGFQKDGSAKNSEATRLGHGYSTAKAATWRTFAEVTVWADGHGEVEVKRDGEILHTFRFEAES